MAAKRQTASKSGADENKFAQRTISTGRTTGPVGGSQEGGFQKGHRHMRRRVRGRQEKPRHGFPWRGDHQIVL
jgi:hypothetical protein